MSLKLWLPLNNDFTNLGCSNITFNKHANNTFVDGKIGKALGATANNSSTVTLTGLSSLLANGKQYSLCCWAKLTGTPTSSWVIQLGNNQCGLWWAKSTARWVWNENDNGKRCANPTISGDYNNWHHLVTTIDKTNPSTIVAKHYVDGLPAASYETQTWDNGSNVEPIGDTITLYPYAAILNDIRLYDHVLSAAEVHEIAMGLVLHYKLDGNNFGNENLSTETQTSLTFTPSGGNDWFKPVGFYSNSENGLNLIHNSTDNDLFTVSFDYTATNVERAWELRPSLKYTSTSFSQPNWTKITSTAYLPVGNSSGHFEGTFYTTAGQRSYGQSWLLSGATTSTTVNRNVVIVVKNFKFEQGDKATCWCPSPTDSLYTILGMNELTIADSSGYGHNGAVIGETQCVSDTPRYNLCTHFSDTAHKIFINNFPTSGFANSYSFAWWAKISSTTPMHWGFADGNRLNGLYTGRLWNTNDSSNNPLYVPGTTTQVTAPTVNVWHHWVMTGDGTTCKVYQDGELWGIAKTYKPINGTQIYINGWANSTAYSSNDYSISDFRIYCTPLLDTDIKLLYNIGMRADNLGALHSYNFNENSDTSKLLKTGTYKVPLLIENNYLFNDKSGWSYSPNGGNNSCVSAADNIKVDLSAFVELGQSVTVQVEGDLAWSNITPNENGTFAAYFQGARYKIGSDTSVWSDANYVTSKIPALTSQMKSNATGSTHIKVQNTIPASWFNTYEACIVSFRTDYATGTITLTNLKVTLVPNKCKINSKYTSSSNFIEL